MPENIYVQDIQYISLHKTTFSRLTN